MSTNIDEIISKAKNNADGFNSSPEAPAAMVGLPAGWDANTAVLLAVAILLFGIAIFIGMVFLLKNGSKTEDVLKICALPLVIISAIFLVVIGYAYEQIAPVISLLSAIAGYLLGSKSSSSG